MSSFTIWDIQSAVPCESGRVPSRKSVYFDISKLICISCTTSCTFCCAFSCTMCYTFYCALSLRNLRVSLSLFIDCTRKQTLLIKGFNFIFIKDLPSVSQSNGQAEIMHIKFQNCWIFSFSSIFKEDS